MLVDQAFQFAEWMHQGSGPGPLRLPGAKSLHTKVGADAARLPLGGRIALPGGGGGRTWLGGWVAAREGRGGEGSLVVLSGWCAGDRFGKRWCGNVLSTF